VHVLTAPAKLTTSLRVTGVRPDGYHLIDAEMVSLDFADTLEVVDGGHGLDLIDDETGRNIEFDGPNLVTKALELCGRDASVTIRKRIPAGAGLGGGSSDAAAILRWAGYGDAVGAASIGADVAFCLSGGRARVTGIGERLETLGFEPVTFTLLTPPFGCSTPAVYAEWDRLGGPIGKNGNDLEPAAMSLWPELGRWKDLLGDESGQTPRLAGSGSTWFVLGEYPGDGRIVAQTLPATPN